jgi:hypothetical protein
MTFAEFLATRRYGAFATLIPEADWEGYDHATGYVYGSGWYIVDVEHPDGRYELTLGNESWLSDDLGEFERRLYEWVAAEMQWGDEGGPA